MGIYPLIKLSILYSERNKLFEEFKMGVLFSIIGIILSLISGVILVRNIIIDEIFVIKKVKIIGFQAYTYVMPGVEYSTIYNARIYPVIELNEGEEKIRVAISTVSNNKLEKGDEIEVIYPKGKLDKIKVYKRREIYIFYSLTLIIGILIVILSTALI